MADHVRVKHQLSANNKMCQISLNISGYNIWRFVNWCDIQQLMYFGKRDFFSIFSQQLFMVLSSATTSMFLTLLTGMVCWGTNDEIRKKFVAHIRVQHATSAAAVLRRKFSQLWYHTEVHRLDNSVITTLSCSVNNRSHHKWLSEQNRLILCSIYMKFENFIKTICSCLL